MKFIAATINEKAISYLDFEKICNKCIRGHNI